MKASLDDLRKTRIQPVILRNRDIFFSLDSDLKIELDYFFTLKLHDVIDDIFFIAICDNVNTQLCHND